MLIGDGLFGVVTVPSIIPLNLAAGLIAIIWVSLSMEKLMTAIASKKTPVAFVKLVPLIVMMAPPFTNPCVGLMLIRVGEGRSSDKQFRNRSIPPIALNSLSSSAISYLYSNNILILDFCTYDPAVLHGPISNMLCCICDFVSLFVMIS